MPSTTADPRFDEDIALARKCVVGAQPHDVCHCGDYRHEHDDRGCKVCRSMPTPWSPRCESFRLTTPTF